MKLLTTALGEDISRWPTSSLNRYFSLIYQMTPRLLALIDSKTLHSAIPFLSQVSTLSLNHCMHGVASTWWALLLRITVNVG